MAFRIRDPYATCTGRGLEQSSYLSSQYETIPRVRVAGDECRDAIEQDVLRFDIGFPDQCCRSCIQRRLMPVRPAQCPVQHEEPAEEYEKNGSDESQ
jgi:hypothetical protein